MTVRDLAQIIRRGWHIKTIRFEQCDIDFADARELPSG